MSLFLYSPSSWPFFSKQPFLCSSSLCCSTLFSSPQRHCSVFPNKICLFCRLTQQICPYKCTFFSLFFFLHTSCITLISSIYIIFVAKTYLPQDILTKHRSLIQRIVINWNTLTNRHFRILMLGAKPICNMKLMSRHLHCCSVLHPSSFSAESAPPNTRLSQLSRPVGFTEAAGKLFNIFYYDLEASGWMINTQRGNFCHVHASLQDIHIHNP